jgi:hypothetical protein
MNTDVLHVPAPSQLRRLLARSLGAELTPELAARFEAAAGQGGQAVDPWQFHAHFSGRIAFRAVSLRGKLDRLRALNDAQAAEMPGQERLDFEDLCRREAAGDLLQFIAQDGTELVGQIRVFLGVTKTGLRQATEESVFLAKPYRVGRNLPAFVGYAERCLGSLGLQRVRIEAPDDRRGLPRLAEILGYQREKVVLVKNLENPPCR